MTAPRLEYTRTGIVLRDEHGERVVSMTLVRDRDGATIVTVGQWPAETHLPAEAVDHMDRLWARMARSLRFPASAMRSSLPPQDLPQVASFWG